MNAPSTLTYLLGEVLYVINDILVPLLFAVAFIVFLYGVFKYFIQGAASSDKSEGARFVMYGVVGFAIMVCIWGLVNLAVNTVGLDDPYHPNYPTL